MPTTRKKKAASGIGGALGGAATGATLGSIVPGVGTLLGAGAGGLIGLLGGLFGAGETEEGIRKKTKRALELSKIKNKNKKQTKELAKLEEKYPGIVKQAEQIYATPQGKALIEGNAQIKGNPQEGYPAQEVRFQRFTPEQQLAMSSILQNTLSELGKNQLDFAPIEQQARSGFAQKTVPSIAERFSQLGAQKSNAFAQTLGQAGKDLETDLAALRAQYGLSKQQALQRLLETGLTPQYSSTWFPGQPGTGGQTVGGGWGQVGENLVGFLSNPEIKEAFNNWRNSRQASAAAANPQLPASNASGFEYTPQLVNPGTNQVNALNAMQAVYGIGNQNQNPTNAGFVNPSAPITGTDAARFLYGL